MTFKPVSAVARVDTIQQVVSVASQDFLPVAAATVNTALPPEVQKAVPGLIQELLKPGAQIIDFSEGVQTRVSQFADKMLDNVGMTNIGEFQKPLTDVLVLCSTVNASSIQGGKLNSHIPFWGKFKLMFASTKARAMSNINSVRGQIDDIVKELIKKENALRANITTLEDMYLLNMQEYYSIMAHIQALDHVMSKKKAELNMFASQHANNSDPLIGLEISTRQDVITAMDKKLYDLRAIGVSCLNTAPMIRSEQRASAMLLDKFRSIRNMAIPYWKKQAALLISSIENQKGAVLGKQITDTTNSMTKAHADAVAKNAVDTARLNERGVIDVETLEHATNSLVGSVQEMLKIAEDGSKYRQDANVKFEDLKKSLAQNVVAKGFS